MLAVESLAGPGRCDVATIGRLQVEPGAANVIPSRVVMSLDVRSPRHDRLEVALEELGRRAKEIGNVRGVEVELDLLAPTRPVPADPAVEDIIEAAARALGLESLRLPSGAGHDCAILAGRASVGMIFVPSRGGSATTGLRPRPTPRWWTGPGCCCRCLIDLDAAAR